MHKINTRENKESGLHYIYMAIFKGAGVAIVTPMKDSLDVNYDKLEELVDEQIAGGTDAIIITGTTGESSTMTEAEHLDVIRACVNFTKGRVPVIAGTGSNCTKTAVYLSQEAEKAGADGLLVVTPYYNKATQQGLIAHYTQIAEAVKLPIIMYNVPGFNRWKAGYVFRRGWNYTSFVGDWGIRRNFRMVECCTEGCA